MNPNCKYEVHTYWRWFRLDEGAYQDYLAGKLWITWVPGKPNQSQPIGSDPVHVSDEALKYRELAARSDAYTVCYQFFATGKATVPYEPLFGCQVPAPVVPASQAQREDRLRDHPCG